MMVLRLRISETQKWKIRDMSERQGSLLKTFILVTLASQICQPGNALILSVGDKCDGVKGETLNLNRDQAENTSSLVLGADLLSQDAPSCDPSMPLECMAGRCQCKRGFTISRNGTKCLEIARNGLDSPCEESIQCWKGLLGRLSECRKDTGRCRCYESETLPIVFHQGRCYYGESLGDFCQITGLCEATTPNAECRTTCQCKEGYIPSWDKSRCLQIAIHGLNSSCEENVQCEKSVLGTLSECNQETMKCQCYQIPMVPTVFYAGKCYFGAALGDVCQVSPQCIAKTEHSLCGNDGKCKCAEGYVPNGNNTACLPIPSADGSSSISGSDCIEDIQCIKALGHFARCNSSKRRCECYVPHDRRENETTFSPFTTEFASPEEPATAMVIIGSKCHTARHLGQSCKFNKQCSATTSNAICYNGLCECREETHVPSNDGRKCLEIAKNGLNSDCDEDPQCVMSSLGQLATCNREKNKCECSSILPVVYYDKKCYFHRQLGSPCESHSECKAGGNFFAECLQGRCQCTNGTEPFTDHSCIHSSSGSRSVVLRNLFIPSLAPLIAVLCTYLVP